MEALNNRKLIVIAGPTAVGKTDTAIRLAQHFRTGIVSADARQVYKELGVGVAKPTADQLASVPHHFISSHSIHEAYNAASYGDDALAVITKLFKDHDRVILCGGSGLYIKAVTEGFDEMPDVDPEVRDAIVKDYEEKGLAWLQEEVKKRDPEYYATVDQKNPHRLIRSLELSMSTGTKMSDWRKQSRRQHDFSIVKIGITLPTSELYPRIDSRMDQMIAEGLFEEAEQLYPYRDLQALQTVGYREIFAFMDHAYDKAEAIRLLKRNSRRYAKRQMTWFAREKDFTWFRPPYAKGSLPAGGQSGETKPPFAEPDQWNEIVNLATAP